LPHGKQLVAAWVGDERDTRIVRVHVPHYDDVVALAGRVQMLETLREMDGANGRLAALEEDRSFAELLKTSEMNKRLLALEARSEQRVMTNLDERLGRVEANVKRIGQAMRRVYGGVFSEPWSVVADDVLAILKDTDGGQ
jgi:hypothetical protein